VVSPGQRRTGVARALLTAAVEHAFVHGAAVVEGYPVDPAQRPKAGPADLDHAGIAVHAALAGHERAAPGEEERHHEEGGAESPGGAAHRYSSAAML
jgi:GNAT superfamily N-acetyltransferase